MNIFMTAKADRYEKDCICNSGGLGPNAHTFSLHIIFSHSSDSKTYFPFLLIVSWFLFSFSFSKASESLKLGGTVYEIYFIVDVEANM